MNRRKTSHQTNSNLTTSANRWAIWVGTLGVVALSGFIVLGLASEPQSGLPEGVADVTVDPPTHVEGDIYEDHEVPAGGAHSQVWLNCGFYSEPVPAENAVHSLEHGAVWITYGPNVPESEISTLRDLASPVEKVLVSPIPEQESNIVLTSWARKLELDSVTDDRLEQFVRELAGSLSAPEPGGACTGGVGDPA